MAGHYKNVISTRANQIRKQSLETNFWPGGNIKLFHNQSSFNREFYANLDQLDRVQRSASKLVAGLSPQDLKMYMVDVLHTVLQLSLHWSLQTFLPINLVI